jgi:hypothetical protein
MDAARRANGGKDKMNFEKGGDTANLLQVGMPNRCMKRR